MKIELEIGTNELGHDLVEQVMLSKLKDDLHTCENPVGYVHPNDKKYNKKLAKAIKRILNYYGEA